MQRLTLEQFRPVLRLPLPYQQRLRNHSTRLLLYDIMFDELCDAVCWPSISSSRSRSRSGCARRSSGARGSSHDPVRIPAEVEPAAEPAEANIIKTGDELLDMLQDFDEEATDIEEAQERRDKAAEQLQDQCLQRQLQREAEGRVEQAQAAQAAQAAREIEDLERTWIQAMEACADLPIDFPDYYNAILAPGEDLVPIQYRLACRADRPFYVGGTVNVQRRWLGDGNMKPHSDAYDSMCILAIAAGKFGGQLETQLIRYALEQFSQTCLNKAPDSRGLTDGNNFIYMCLQE